MYWEKQYNYSRSESKVDEKNQCLSLMVTSIGSKVEERINDH